MTLSTSEVAVCCSAIGEFALAHLHLVEQPRVLDGNDRLVGEGGDQLDLLVGEWPRRHCVHSMIRQSDSP